MPWAPAVGAGLTSGWTRRGGPAYAGGNKIPGHGPITAWVPMRRAAGIDFDELACALLETSVPATEGPEDEVRTQKKESRSSSAPVALPAITGALCDVLGSIAGVCAVGSLVTCDDGFSPSSQYRWGRFQGWSPLTWSAS